MDRLLALFNMFNPPTEVEDLEAREQRRDEFPRFGLEQINESLSSSVEVDEGYSGDEGDSLPSIPSAGEVCEAEEVRSWTG